MGRADPAIAVAQADRRILRAAKLYRRPRDRKMIESIATRDKPGTTDPGISQFLADAELKFGEQIPTGTYLDMTANLPLVDPKKVKAPVLLIRGEYDKRGEKVGAALPAALPAVCAPSARKCRPAIVTQSRR